MSTVRPVTVAVVGTRTEAELIVGMLLDHGLTAEVSADDVARLDLALQAQGVRVLVPAHDATAAFQLLGDAEADDRVGGPPLSRFQRWIVRRLGGGVR
jgi:hypothetical protein